MARSPTDATADDRQDFTPVYAVLRPLVPGRAVETVALISVDKSDGSVCPPELGNTLLEPGVQHTINGRVASALARKSWLREEPESCPMARLGAQASGGYRCHLLQSTDEVRVPVVPQRPAPCELQDIHPSEGQHYIEPGASGMQRAAEVRPKPFRMWPAWPPAFGEPSKTQPLSPQGSSASPGSSSKGVGTPASVSHLLSTNYGNRAVRRFVLATSAAPTHPVQGRASERRPACATRAHARLERAVDYRGCTHAPPLKGVGWPAGIRTVRTSQGHRSRDCPRVPSS